MFLRKLTIILTFTMIFLGGWVSQSVYSTYTSELTILLSDKTRTADTTSSTLKPYTHALTTSLSSVFIEKPSNKPSPKDHIKEEQIFVNSDHIELQIKDAQWTGFTDTYSMDPVLDSEANGIEIVPKSPEEISVGDVISYELSDGSIIAHRVIGINYDSEGVYYLLKGDNNPKADDGRIRFEQVRGILVAVVY